MSKHNNIYKIQHTCTVQVQPPTLPAWKLQQPQEASDSTPLTLLLPQGNGQNARGASQKCHFLSWLLFSVKSETQINQLFVKNYYLLWKKCFSFENQAPLTYKSSSLTCKRVRSDLAAEQQQPVNDCKKKETNTLLPKVSPSWRCFARLKTTSLYFPTASLSLSAFWL